MPRPSLTALLACLLMCSGVAHASYQAELPMPPNQKVSLQLSSPISTATNKTGDKFACKVLTPAAYSGAIVEGHIRSLKRSGKADKESKIDLAFDRITTPDGRTAKFVASVVEVFDVADTSEQGRADNEGLVTSNPRVVKTSIKRAAAGALMGALVGGLIAGGKGAAIGAAVGASVGVTTTLASKGPDLEFKTGTQFTVETSGPQQRPQTKRQNKEEPAP